MTRGRILETIIASLLLIIFVGIVFHAPLSIAAGTFLPGDLLIKAWKEILMAIAGVGLVLYLSINKAWALFVRDPLVWLIGVYGLLHIALLAFDFQGAVPAAAGLLIDLRYVAYFALVYMFLRAVPRYRKMLLTGGLIAAVVSLGFALLQVTVLPQDILRYIGYGTDTILPYMTVDKSEDYIRINGTLRGPNPLGAYAAIVLTFATAFALKHWRMLRKTSWRLLFVLLCVSAVVALWWSYSRSALGAAVAGVGLVIILHFRQRIPIWVWVSGVAVAGMMIGGLLLSWNTPFVQQVLLHNNPSGGSARDSNEEHVNSLQEGLERMAAQPLGGGIGSTGSASLYGDDAIIIENQYLFVAHETGWIGLALFLLLFGIILQRAWRYRRDWLAMGVCASGIGMALIGLLLPVWSDDTVAIVWWGLAAIALSTHTSDIIEKRKQPTHARSIKQKTTRTTAIH